MFLVVKIRPETSANRGPLGQGCSMPQALFLVEEEYMSAYKILP